MPILSVTPEEWGIATLFFAKNPEAKKLRRKDRESWEGHAKIYLKDTSPTPYDEGLVQKIADLLNRPIPNTEHEKWRPGEMDVHSFHKIEGELFASTVHALLYQQASNRPTQTKIRILESQSGTQITQSTSLYRAPEYIRKNAAVLEKLHRKDYEYIDGKKCREFREYYNGDLIDFFKIFFEKMTPPQIMKLFLKCLSEFKALHDDNVIHGDINPHNFLCKFDASQPLDDIIDTMVIHVIDFEYCRFLEERDCLSTAALGTDSYMAPEVRRETIIGLFSDVYSFVYSLQCFLSFSSQRLYLLLIHVNDIGIIHSL